MASRPNYNSKKKSIDFIRWCKCEQCFKMTAKTQEKCCRKTEGKCVTEDPDFKNFVQNNLNDSWKQEDVLTEERPYWCVLEDPELCPGEDPEEVKKRQLRRKAFGLLKDSTGWQINLPDDFDKGWKDTLPSCVVWYVRLQEKFRAKSGLYTGYFPDTEDILQLAVAAAENFNKKITNIKKVAEIVEQDKKEIGPLSVTVKGDVMVELISMGIVNTVTAFEAFAYDALWTSFEIGYSKTVHCTRDQFDAWIVRRIKHDDNKAQASCSEDNDFWKLFVSDPEKQKINEAFENWTDSKNWGEMYKYYARTSFPELTSDAKRVVAVTRTILSDISSWTCDNCQPVADSFKGILSTLLDSQPPGFDNNRQFVLRLFKFFLDKSCCWLVHLPPASGNDKAPPVRIKKLSFKQLRFVSNLFYGIRCRLAHGNVKRTTEEGKLNMEMEDYNITFLTDGLCACKDEDSGRVTDYFKNLLEEAKKEKMHVDYYLFNTMQSFYKYFVHVLGKTCACVVYFILCQLRFVDCSRGKAFRLAIGTIRDAIKKASIHRYRFIMQDAQGANQPP